MSSEIFQIEKQAEMLPMDVIVDLAKKKDAGDVRARQKLIVSHLWLVKKESLYTAQRLNKMNLKDDLYQEACIGLIEAVDKYDWKRNVYLSTYAVHWIRKRLSRYFHEKESLIKLPEYLYYACFKYKEHFQCFIEKNNRKPTREESAEALGLPVTTIKKIPKYNALLMPTSDIDNYNGSKNGDNEEEKEFIISPERVLENISGPDFSDYKVILTPKEEKILRLRFGYDNQPQQTFSEIAVIVGISDESVRKMYKCAIDKIKKGFDHSEQPSPVVEDN